MTSVVGFLTRTRGRRADWTDWLSYGYLLVGLFLMFGPVLWLGLSSFKSQAALNAFPPSLLPYEQARAAIAGQAEPRPLYRITRGPLAGRALVELRRVGLEAQMVDPSKPGELIRIPTRDRTPVMRVHPAIENYADLLGKFSFGTYFWNSIFITLTATVITLLINSMAAFALSKYRFRGGTTVFVLILSTLMIPPTIILVPNYLLVSAFGLVNSPWGVIWPTVATPTGVFLLRQYMLTIPDELIEAARMDHASEWRIYWRIVLPLSAPALAVLAIFSTVWRWNDFLWPLIVLNRNETFTLQLALNAFQGDLQTQWNYLLAMTVLTLLPVTLIFAFLQRHIVQGIASTGLK